MAPNIDAHGDKDDRSSDCLLRIGVDVHQHHAIRNDSGEGGSDDGALHTAHAAREARAPDRSGGDHVELDTEAGGRLGRKKARERHDASQGRNGPGQCVNDELGAGCRPKVV